VQAFNRYDLYSKGLERPNVELLEPYYRELIDEYFPSEVNW
jgi:inositol oxygenase